MRLGRAMMDTLEQHYPERMVKIYVVNAPGSFPAIWRMLSPLLDPHTAEKIRVAAPGRLGAREALLEIMDEEQIPEEYGGKVDGEWYQSQEERKLFALAAALNGNAG
jgi:hypothetical protein